MLSTLLKGAREKTQSDDARLAEAMRTLGLRYAVYGGASPKHIPARRD